MDTIVKIRDEALREISEDTIKRIKELQDALTKFTAYLKQKYPEAFSTEEMFVAKTHKYMLDINFVRNRDTFRKMQRMLKSLLEDMNATQNRPPPPQDLMTFESVQLTKDQLRLKKIQAQRKAEQEYQRRAEQEEERVRRLMLETSLAPGKKPFSSPPQSPPQSRPQSPRSPPRGGVATPFQQASPGLNLNQANLRPMNLPPLAVPRVPIAPTVTALRKL